MRKLMESYGGFPEEVMVRLVTWGWVRLSQKRVWKWEGEEANIAQQREKPEAEESIIPLRKWKASRMPAELNKLETRAGVRACRALLAMCITPAARLCCRNRTLKLSGLTNKDLFPCQVNSNAGHTPFQGSSSPWANSDTQDLTIFWCCHPNMWLSESQQQGKRVCGSGIPALKCFGPKETHSSAAVQI